MSLGLVTEKVKQIAPPHFEIKTTLGQLKITVFYGALCHARVSPTIVVVATELKTLDVYEDASHLRNTIKLNEIPKKLVAVDNTTVLCLSSVGDIRAISII